MPAGGGYLFEDFPRSSHRRLLAFLPPPPGKVLDVGTAGGYMGVAPTARRYTVVGIEADARAECAAAPAYAAMYRVDVSARPPIHRAPFDVVMLADVLEHQSDPAATLAWAVGLLAAGGRVLVFVSKETFLAARPGLLVGRFQSQPRGILDRTHVRFDTRRSLLQAMRSAGLQPQRALGVPPPLPLVFAAAARWPGRVLLEVAALAARLWPQLFACQFVAEATR